MSLFGLLATLLATVQTGIQNRDYIACYEEGTGAWLGCVLGPYTNLLGDAVFGALLVGPISVALFIYSGSIALPAVLLALLMGSIMSGVPAQVGLVVYAFVAIGLTLAYRSLIFTRSST